MSFLGIFEGVGSSSCDGIRDCGTNALGSVEATLLIIGGGLVPDLELIDTFCALTFGGR